MLCKIQLLTAKSNAKETKIRLPTLNVCVAISFFFSLFLKLIVCVKLLKNNCDFAEFLFCFLFVKKKTHKKFKGYTNAQSCLRCDRLQMIGIHLQPQQSMYVTITLKLIKLSI